MTAAQLKDLVTKDPLEALKAILDYIQEDKTGEITQNLRHLAEVQLAVRTRDAINAADDLTRAAEATTDRYEQEKFYRDRLTWEKMAEKANNAMAKPATLQKLGLPHLKQKPVITIIPLQRSEQGNDTYFLDFWVNENSYVNANYGEVKTILVTQYATDSTFKRINRIDTLTRRFEIKDWKVAKQKSWSVDQIAFAALSSDQNRFGKFFVKSKIIYEIDQMKTVESRWTVLRYDFARTRFKVNRYQSAIGFRSR